MDFWTLTRTPRKQTHFSRVGWLVGWLGFYGISTFVMPNSFLYKYK